MVALLWTTFGLFLALLIVLPAPILTLWGLSVLASGFALLLATYAIVGFGLAVPCWRTGALRVAIVSVAFGVATVALSLPSTAQGWRTAQTEGVPRSAREYFAGPSVISDRSATETRVYAHPEGSEGEELKLDVHEPSGGAESAARSDSRPAVTEMFAGVTLPARRSPEVSTSRCLLRPGTHLAAS